MNCFTLGDFASKFHGGVREMVHRMETAFNQTTNDDTPFSRQWQEFNLKDLVTRAQDKFNSITQDESGTPVAKQEKPSDSGAEDDEFFQLSGRHKKTRKTVHIGKHQIFLETLTTKCGGWRVHRVYGQDGKFDASTQQEEVRKILLQVTGKVITSKREEPKYLQFGLLLSQNITKEFVYVEMVPNKST